jgi:aspartokinase/homoserine dehydrogenase 1
MNTQYWLSLLQQHYPIDIQPILSSLKPKVRKLHSVHPKRSAWNVHKFGGSSFENADSYSFVASLINKFDGKNLVVVSALSGITNHLYALCRRVKIDDNWLESEEWTTLVSRIGTTIKKRLGNSQSGFKETQRFAADLIYLINVLNNMAISTPEEQDSIEQLVVGYGEIWSARLMTQTMRDDFHRSAAFLDAREVLVVKQVEGNKIEVCWDITKERLKKWFYHCRWCDVLIVTGFIARHLDTEFPVTLKRNGSDFSATIFSVLTKANSVTIWKDVDGMFTSDPKKNPDARFIPEQTYEEAEDASRKGAFVIQADCIEPAKVHGVPIFLRNCFKLECPGTRIGNPLPKHNALDSDCNAAEEDHLLDSIQNQNAFAPSCSESDSAALKSFNIGEEHNILEIIV